MALVEIKDVSFKYQLADQFSLKRINLRIEEGDFYAIVGANGSGKSSLCYAIRGFIPHFYHGELSGDVLVAGENNRQRKLGEIGLDVGFIFQNPFSQISGVAMNVYEEVGYGLENLGVGKDMIIRRVDEIIALLGIEHLRERNPYELSGGEQQKVAIASVMVMAPRILILDEPTSQLDPIGTEQVFDAIELMKNKGMTIILVEHKLELISHFANKVAVLKDGEVLLDGSIQDVFTNPMFARSGIKPPVYVQLDSELKKHFDYRCEPVLTHEQCTALLHLLKERSAG
ncbi:MAG: ABC transporter ATP-binding protein [Syntrophomonadaceae bacterium]|jgi:energy-coupling factor transport system ATP-binding protein|nr:ABC transporter ATP-binding protein [Syntrophomonadaceae bacterium]